MTTRRGAAKMAICGLLLAAIAACSPSSLASGGANRDVTARQPTRLTLAFNSDAEITVRDPHGRVLHFGKDVPEWRNDFGASANFPLGDVRPQVVITDPPIGTWKIGVGVKSDMRVLSLQGFTNKGCLVDDNMGPVQGGVTYWWRMRIKLGAVPDTCRATLSRARPVKLAQ
jgi:hypothetical protein